MLDLIIKNGQCYIDGKLKDVNVAIKGGKIQQQLAEVRNIRKNPKSVTSPFVTGIKLRNLPSEVESMIKTFVQMRSSDKRSGGR